MIASFRLFMIALLLVMFQFVVARQPSGSEDIIIEREGVLLKGKFFVAYSVNHPEITSVFSIVGNDFGEFMREYVRNPEMKKIVDEMMDNAKENVRFEKGALPREMAEAGIENMNPIYDIRQKGQ